MAEQGPLEEIKPDAKLKEQVNSQVMDILRTIFSWYDLPWRELTYENMFDKASLLKKVDKEAIRFSKFVPSGMATAYEDVKNIT